MNQIKCVDSYYLRSSRTIELIEISNTQSSTRCFVYNYEGYHFRFFSDFNSLLSFFFFDIQPEHDFDSEAALDDFLEKESTFYDGISGKSEVLGIPITIFKEKAIKMLHFIMAMSEESFAIPEVEDFMQSIQYISLKADSYIKTDNAN